MWYNKRNVIYLSILEASQDVSTCCFRAICSFGGSWILILLTVFIISCKDENKLPLPKATQIGAGTFGCKVNGKSLISDRSGTSAVVIGNHSISMILDGGRLYSKQVNIDFDSVDFEIQENQRYEFDNSGKIRFRYINYGRGPYCEFEETPITGGVMFTRLDTVTRIISGIFDFSGRSSKCDKLVDITDGRFDIHFYYTRN